MADQRWAELLETGESIPWDEARRYFKARAAGQEVQRPVARKLDE